MNDELLFKEIKKTQDPTLFRIFLDKWEDEVYRYALVATGKKEDEALDLATKIFLDLWNLILEGAYHEPIDRWIRYQVRLRVIKRFRRID